MDYSQLTTRDLLLWCLSNKDDEALSELVKRFEPIITAHARVQGRVDEDIAQQIRLILIQSIKNYYKNFSK
ncbi:MAG: Helix-turn-helix domain [Bacilli bacterium]|nr:Helix-turn-helix domain [Bacilli bacterium]